MAEEGTQMAERVKALKKRKSGHKKGGKPKKKQKQLLGVPPKAKRMDPRLKKMLRKKARDYNSDNDDDNDDDDDNHQEAVEGKKDLGIEVEEVEGSEDNDEEEEESDEIQPGITKFLEGCIAFRKAFQKIMKTGVSGSSLGPVLSGQKELLAEKLAEELVRKKAKREARKEKQLVGEKGHVKPDNYLDTHEKFLISVATKGVVKLFNAVNKAQSAQKGLNPSRTKDEKVIKKRSKAAFFSELGKNTAAKTPAKVNTSSGSAGGEGPSWAPLRDNYMLTDPKLKNWDKLPQDTAVADDIGVMSGDSTSDDD